jgi:flagellar hook-associated protein 2
VRGCAPRVTYSYERSLRHRFRRDTQRMSAISSSVGLITGIPIEETVDQLMTVASRPRTTLLNRTNQLKSEQTALDTLSSLVLGLQFSTGALNRNTTFGARTANSSDRAAVATSVSTGSSPTPGSYQLTPLKSASAHQLVSASIGDLTNALGNGELKLSFGGRVNKGVALTEINGGAGFQAGQIKITDRAGDSATIDLRAATTIDEVLNAINSSDEIDVTASVQGDQIILKDNTGEAGTLRVREAGGGTTAASLGLTTTASGDTLTGTDIFSLSGSTKLASLNDGLGVAVNELKDIEDIVLKLADGTTAKIDLSNSVTLADFVDAVNEEATLQGKVTVAIAPDGNRLTVTDHTTPVNNGKLTIEGTAADDLGLDKTSVGGIVTGKRLVAGLGGTLLKSLNGGTGVDAGKISITNRAGDTAVEVDLSAAETIDDVIATINSAASGIEVTASINSSGNGILLTDASGGTGSLIVGEVGNDKTAADLGLLIDEATNSFDTGSLNRQTVGRGTKLSTLRGGEGVSRGQIKIADSKGKESTIDLRFTGVDNPTLGDVIDKINASAVDVTASLNKTGDGILITDTADGSGKLSVAEVGGGQVASQLRIAGASKAKDGDNQQIIDGTTELSFNLEDIAESAGETLLTAVNAGAGVDLGLVKITNSQGVEKTINLNGAVTVQDAIDEINDANIGVTAELNSNGSGIELKDTAGGNKTLKLEDVTGSAAKDLRLNTAPTTNGFGEQVINGRGLMSSGTPIEQLAKRINEFDAGYAASVIYDGDGYRLSLTSEKTGAANEIVISGVGTSLSFTETSRASDAVALFGQGGAGGVTVTSSDGKFNNLISGVNIDVLQATGNTVRIDVAQNDAPLKTAINDFVASYNSIRDNLKLTTSFDPEELTTGILFGRNEVVRVDSDLSRLASGRFTTGGRYNSLESIGISLGADGKLSIDQGQLDSALAADRSAVEKMFRDEDNGVVAKFTDATDRLAGDEKSLLPSRTIALTGTIEANEARLLRFDDSLARQREALLTQFYKLEETIALLQSNLDSVSGIQPISIQSNRNS